jgi:hypothetical protein
MHFAIVFEVASLAECFEVAETVIPYVLVEVCDGQHYFDVLFTCEIGLESITLDQIPYLVAVSSFVVFHSAILALMTCTFQDKSAYQRPFGVV